MGIEDRAHRCALSAGPLPSTTSRLCVHRSHGPVYYPSHASARKTVIFFCSFNNTLQILHIVHSHRKVYIPLHSIFFFLCFLGLSKGSRHSNLPTLLHTFVTPMAAFGKWGALASSDFDYIWVTACATSGTSLFQKRSLEFHHLLSPLCGPK